MLIYFFLFLFFFLIFFFLKVSDLLFLSRYVNWGPDPTEDLDRKSKEAICLSPLSNWRAVSYFWYYVASCEHISIKDICLYAKGIFVQFHSLLDFWERSCGDKQYVWKGFSMQLWIKNRNSGVIITQAEIWN